MADLSDVEATLVNMIAAALYPNGTGQASAISAPCKVYPGWPNSTALDADLRAGTVHVTVFPMAGATAQAAQFLDNMEVLVPAVHGLSASISGQTITLTGTPGASEYVTVIADGKYIFSRVGASGSAICSALLADALAHYPSASANGATLTIPNAAYITVRIGAPATMANIVHRQKQAFMITTWASTDALRSACAALVDVSLKSVNRITFSDTSQGIMTFDRTMVNDLIERAICYRRDLIFNVEYATIETFQAFEVTSFTTEADPNWTDSTYVAANSIT